MNQSSGDGRWRVASATVQGVSHCEQGIPCQDSCRWAELPDGMLLVAVADGCGSARYAALGSVSATQAALDHAAQCLNQRLPATPPEWHDLLRAVLQRAHGVLGLQAAELRVEPAQLATTLLVALIHSEFVAAAQVGDGAIVARVGDERLEAITRPPLAEYVNETAFLTSATFLERAQFVVHQGAITGLGMFTDGLQMLALQMPRGLPHRRFFAPLFQVMAQAPADKPVSDRQLQTFLQSPPVAERTHDDLLLFLAVLDGDSRRRQPRQTMLRGASTASEAPESAGSIVTSKETAEQEKAEGQA
jgi:hypothetical protein